MPYIKIKHVEKRHDVGKPVGDCEKEKAYLNHSSEENKENLARYFWGDSKREIFIYSSESPNLGVPDSS